MEGEMGECETVTVDIDSRNFTKNKILRNISAIRHMWFIYKQHNADCDTLPRTFIYVNLSFPCGETAKSGLDLNIIIVAQSPLKVIHN